MLSRTRYFKSINLFVGVILCHISPKALPKECCYLWCLSMIRVFSYPLGESSFHLFIDLKQSIVSVSGQLSPHHFEMFAISPQQACAFRCWFSNNSVQFFFARMLSKFICGRSWHFLLHSIIPMIYLLFFLLEALWCCSFHSSSRIVRIMFFVLIHLTGVLYLLFKFFSSYQVFLYLSVGVLPKLYQSYSFSI